MRKIVKYFILFQSSIFIIASCNKDDHVKVETTPADTTAGDLVISYLKIQEWTPVFISYEFTIKNIGGHSVDIKQLTVQGWISKDTIYDGSDYGAGGYLLYSQSSWGNLAPKQTVNGNWYCGDKDPNHSDFTLNPSTHPYLILQIYGANEVNLSNNTKYVKIV